MNGAKVLVDTLSKAGVELCFSNPGTSEMHLLEALDQSSMRCVLCLFEGVASGAADGYARMARKPAATLLHLGPGFSNAMANLHNARRGHSPVINIVGDHALYHHQYDVPLQSDIEGSAGVVSQWVRSSQHADQLASDTAQAVQAAWRPVGQIATLIVPADVCWNETLHGAITPQLDQTAPLPDAGVIDSVSQLLKTRNDDGSVMILLGGDVTEAQLQWAGALASHSGALLYCDTFPSRIVRGQGCAQVERMPYLPEMAADAMKNIRHIVLVGAKEPVSFFAYPHVESWLLPNGCDVHRLAALEQDVTGALASVAQQIGVKTDTARVYQEAPPALASGELTPSAIAQSIGALLIENAVIVDEGITGGAEVFLTTANSPRHEWIIQGGGAIGWGLPAAVGAALACPDRKIVCLEGDGSGMYTVQALWTMARENLDITVVVFANRHYTILQFEYLHVGAKEMGPSAASQMTIGNPDIDYAGLARSMGVSATQARTAEEFNEQFAAAMQQSGPKLIEAIY